MNDYELYMDKELGVELRNAYGKLNATGRSHPRYFTILNNTNTEVMYNLRTIRENIERSLTNHHENGFLSI